MEWLIAIFGEILHRSILVTILILGIFFLRLFLKKMPKKIAYVLWIVVFVRVLCPYSIPSPLSVSSIVTKNIQEKSTEKNTNTYKQEESNLQVSIGGQLIQNHQSSMDNRNRILGEKSSVDQFSEGTPKTEASKTDTPKASTSSIFSILAIIWGLGMVALCIWNGRKIMGIKRILGIAVKKPTNLAYVVYESDRIPTPFVFGLFRPRIYLPMNLSEADISKVLQHEKVHIQRKDYLIKMIAYLAVILHWFNPLIWLAFAAFTKDMEMSCDEQVIGNQCDKERVDYSMTLLSMAMEQPSPTWSPIAFGNDHTKERIKHILTYERIYSRKRLIPVVAILLLLVACTNDPVNKTQEEQKGYGFSATEGAEAEQTKAEGPTEEELTMDMLEQEGYSSACIKELAANRTEYIGDNSKVGTLVSLLPVYENVDRNEIELDTKEKPYGLTIYYKQKEEKDKTTDYLPIYRNAIILLATIDNADWVSQICFWNNPALSSLCFQVKISRDEVEKNLGITFSSYTKDEEGLTRLLMDLTSDTFIDHVTEYIEQLTPEE
ncbi:M56 family metallopeptidase [Anaerosporobacter faecicola]|uniref:M56 family metallopeptidase n=1 Tax=Anaerosporobacter faecicola TaxID=2718714 RepID=UPI0014399A91|nr:M56 family metallopeptidase [Anaerosporobacter faecicola]